MSSMVHVTVHFFAKSRDLLGRSEAPLEVLEEMTSSALLSAIHEAFPRLKELEGRFALSLNEEYVSTVEDAPLTLSNGDQIAIIPPLSGG